MHDPSVKLPSTTYLCVSLAQVLDDLEGGFARPEASELPRTQAIGTSGALAKQHAAMRGPCVVFCRHAGSEPWSCPQHVKLISISSDQLGLTCGSYHASRSRWGLSGFSELVADERQLLHAMAQVGSYFKTRPQQHFLPRFHCRGWSSHAMPSLWESAQLRYACVEAVVDPFRSECLLQLPYWVLPSMRRVIIPPP